MKTLLILLLAVPSFSQTLDRSVPVPPGPAKTFQVPPLEEKSMSNGMKLALIEMHRLPLVSVDIVLPLAGSAMDPQGKSGLASLVASLMTEGAGGMSSRQFAEALDDIGASIGISADSDAMTVTVFATREHIDEAVGLAAKAIRQPSLPMDQFSLAKEEAQAGLEQEKGNPGARASRKLALRLYGSHPYGQSMTERSLAAITLPDARNFAAARLTPSGAIASAGGDITMPEFETLMKKHFGGWRAVKTGMASAAGAPVAQAASQGLVIDLIDMPGSQQSSIRAGQLLIARDDPDYMTVAVMNFLLGQAPILSRLDKNLRERHGWAYGARSSLSALLQGGDLTISADVQTDATAPAVVEIIKEMKRLQNEPVQGAELLQIKRLMAGLFVQRQQTVQALSAQAAGIELYHLSPDTLAAYRARVMAVTADELQAAARKYLHPESLQVVISGDAARVQKDLAALGTVRLEGAPAPAAQAPASAAK